MKVRVLAGLQLVLEGSTMLIRDALGDSFLAMTVFGDAAPGDHARRKQPIRSVLVVKEVDLPSLRRLAALGPKLAKAGLAAPFVVTPKYIQDSLDTFPLEWLHLQQEGVTIDGDNYFCNLEFQPAHVRLQCERELKRILMGLRQALLAAAGKQSAIPLIEGEAVDSLLRTMRGLLWLSGLREHQPAQRVLEEIEGLVGGKLSGLRGALDHAGTHDWNEFDRLYRDVERLMEKANATA